MKELPIPPHFDATSASRIWRVPYQERAIGARAWACRHDLRPAAQDRFRICLMPIDVQNTFCLPEFELFVGGRSGRGAIDDNVRLCEFIYRHLGIITEISPTMDTHTAFQIFHPSFLVNDAGENPAPLTSVSLEDIDSGRWKVDPAVAGILADGDVSALQDHLRHYCRALAEGGKYQLMIWPYHAMFGGIGHALVSVMEEAIFFHGIARFSRTGFQVKGDNPLTENYSVLRPEVMEGADGMPVADRNEGLIRKLLEFDAVIIAGQAKSHCVAWTIADLLNEIEHEDRALARKVYILEDCTSPVVVPGVVDYTDDADRAFRRFSDAGMNLVRSDMPLAEWPGLAVPEAT